MLVDTSPLFTLVAFNPFFVDSAVKCCEVSLSTLHACEPLCMSELSAVCEVLALKARVGASERDLEVVAYDDDITARSL